MTENQPAKMSDIIARMRAKAAEMPDHVYQTPLSQPGATPGDCFYFEGGDNTCPSCLVGFGVAPIVGPGDFRQVTLHLTIEGEGALGEEFVEATRFAGEEQDAEALLRSLADAGRVEGTQQQMKWIRRVQELQDASDPWGEAIRRADEQYPLVSESA